MSELIDFYDTLSGEPPDTVDVTGVVLAWKNKGKWHCCKKDASSISYLCGSGSPYNPNRKSRVGGDDYYEKKFKRTAKTVSIRQFLEFESVCKNCLREVQKRYDYTRYVFAVPDLEPDSDAWKGEIERFLSKIDKA